MFSKKVVRELKLWQVWSFPALDQIGDFPLPESQVEANGRPGNGASGGSTGLRVAKRENRLQGCLTSCRCCCAGRGIQARGRLDWLYPSKQLLHPCDIADVFGTLFQLLPAAGSGERFVMYCVRQWLAILRVARLPSASGKELDRNSFPLCRQ